MGKIEFKKLNIKLQEYIKNKGLSDPNFDIDKFLNPSLSDLHDPSKLNNMIPACARIVKAIETNEKIVIYGDYDCDGISACTILYLFLKDKGADVDVYIPNRFDDGYGLTDATIDEIEKSMKPKLIITVDLGITAINETINIKNRGIDLIITDHHEMGDTLPDTLVIDPKIPSQEYQYNGLCGTGVALKVIQQIGGINEAYKYFDFAAIATIGDIVPLTDENRAIAKLGLEKINRGECHKSIKHIMHELGLEQINSTDVAFKIVPRINASGRMNTSKKVFDYFIETDDLKLRELFIVLETDNAERLDEIQKGNLEIEKNLENIDISDAPILLVTGDFHQGVLGILSSRISHDYNRPTICFAKTEYGTYKGSGRSIGDIDLHDLTLKCSKYCNRCGGHKMAIGLEVPEVNFNAFKEEITKLAKQTIDEKEYLQNFEYSIEIEESDINKKFIDELETLEPFGANNEKPVFMLRVNELKAEQMAGKSYKHFKYITPTGKQIVAFSSSKHVSLLTNSGEKMLTIELENNKFKGKSYPQALLKNVKMISYNYDETRQENMICSLLSLYNSINSNNNKSTKLYNKRNLIETVKNNIDSLYTTLVVIDNAFDYNQVEELEKLGFTKTNTPFSNKQNAILIRPEGITNINDIVGYKQIFFTRRAFENEHKYLTHKYKIFEPDFITKLSARLLTTREVMGACFVAIKNNMNIMANNIFEWATKLNKIVKNISKAELVFALLVFTELEIFNLNINNLSIEIEKGKNFTNKRELNESKIYNIIQETIEKNV